MTTPRLTLPDSNGRKTSAPDGDGLEAPAQRSTFIIETTAPGVPRFRLP
jgi:hypothetical protein